MKKAFSFLVLLSLVVAGLLLGAPSAGAVSGSSLRVVGTVSAISQGSLTITAAGGQAMSFRLVSTTSYTKDGQAADFSVLAIGGSVRVKYHLEANGSLKAKEVDVKTTTGVASAPVWVTGSVVSVTPEVLVVKNDANGQDLTMRLSPTTVYEKNGRSALVGDLDAGQTVKVKYRVEPDRSLKVQKVKIDLRKPVSFQLEGTIVRTGATSMRVRVVGLRENGALVRNAAGRTVAVALSASTAVLRDRRQARAGALLVGDRVHVSGILVVQVLTADRVVAKGTAKR